MTYAIYGIRLRDDREARYIGQTCAALETRLRGHVNIARAMPVPTKFAQWLTGNIAHVETFEIAQATTRAAALKIEREVVQTCLALNHRLFNRWLVPADQRIPSRDIAPSERHEKEEGEG